MTTGTITLQFGATTIDQIVAKTLEKWREMTGDPEAQLPWSTHFDITQNTLVAGESTMRARVTIEIDKSYFGGEFST